MIITSIETIFKINRYNCEKLLTCVNNKRSEYMNIVINGESKEFKDDTTLLELLKELSLEGKVMAAAINMNIVKQDNWATHKLCDNDKLELLDFVGGG